MSGKEKTSCRRGSGPPEIVRVQMIWSPINTLGYCTRKCSTRLTWKWAGQYRRTERNIGLLFHEIPERLGVLVGDVRHWIEYSTFSSDEIAVRFHYRLVSIHPFPNGNGRHARLISDILATKLGRPPFTWGSTDLIRQGEARAKYLGTIRAADNGDIRSLLEFARS